MLRKLLVFCAALGITLAVMADPTATAATTDVTATAATPAATVQAPAVEKSTVKKASHVKKAKKVELDLNSATADDLVKAGLPQDQADKVVAARPVEGFKNVKEVFKAMDKKGKKDLRALGKECKLETKAIEKDIK